MAEGGNFSRTLDGGSEALFDHVCTECQARGSKQEAADFCQDCKRLLCKICARYHKQYEKTHTLVNIAAMKEPNKTLPTISPVQVVAKCQYHPDQDIEMYCGTHDMVYCCRCIAKEHRSCSDVKDIDDVAHKSSLSTLQTLDRQVTRVITQLHTAKLERSNDLKILQKKKAFLIEEIKAIRMKFNAHLDAIEQKVIAELDEEQNKLEKEVGDDITSVNDLINASDKTKLFLTTQTDEKQMFIAEKLGQGVLTNANTFLEKLIDLKHPLLKFEPNGVLFDVIEQSDHLGNIVRSDTEPKRKPHNQYTLESVNEINVRVKSDENTCTITDMCQLVDGTILLIDDDNNNLKRLDHLLNVKDFLKFEASPVGLCSLSPTEVAVQLDDSTIHFVHVDKSLSDRRKVSINYPQNTFWGLACCRDQFWVPGKEAVDVYSLSGTFVKMIKTDSLGRKIFPEYNPQHIVVSNDGTKVYVSAWEDRVVVFNNDGDVINELRDKRLDAATSLCVTEDDIVLVAGYQSSNVVMFGRDGNQLGELVSSEPMLPDPWSLCYDRKKCRLVVSYDQSDNVQIFQLST